MNCVEASLKIEVRLSYCQRMWSLKRAHQFVRYCTIRMPPVYQLPRVFYGVSSHLKGEFDGNIMITRNQSDADKWRTLVHEIAHAAVDGHGMEFISTLRLVISFWNTFNGKQGFS